MFKSQVYISKGSAPWYNTDYWPDKDKVISIDESIPGQATVTWKDVTDMGSMFYDCNKLTLLDLSSFDTSNVTSMWGMFYGCYRLTALDLSNFDTSNVKNMNYMFSDCNSLTTLDLSNFNTSNVTDMSFMFRNCSSLTSLDLSNFDTSKVTSMNAMFSDCYNLTSLDVSNFDTSKVFSSDMDSMFSNCSSLISLDLSSFDTSEITNMMNMFDSCFNLTTIKGIIDMKSCEWCSNMFTNCHKLKDVKIKNPPSGFNVLSGLSKSQYTIVS